METHYLNVDLDITAKVDLSPLLKDLGEDVLVLHHGIVQGYDHASFEPPNCHFSGPDEALSWFCTLIENLQPEGLAVWNACMTRVFDFGFEAGDSPNRFWVELRPTTIQRIAGIGASIALSIYTPIKENEDSN